MKILITILFVFACLCVSGVALERDIIVVCNQDPHVAAQMAIVNLPYQFDVVFMNSEYFITRPHTNGVVKERYFIVFMQRRYFY